MSCRHHRHFVLFVKAGGLERTPRRPSAVENRLSTGVYLETSGMSILLSPEAMSNSRPDVSWLAYLSGVMSWFFALLIAAAMRSGV